MTPHEDPDIRIDELAQFAALVAHDFNNLLTGILGHLELMQLKTERNGIQGLDAYLDGARNAGARAAELAQRLLQFSGRSAQDPEPVPVAQLLADLAASAEGQGVSFTLPGAALRAWADPIGLNQAVLELLRNAKEVEPEGSQPALSVEETNGQVRILVRDHGPGMAPEILARAKEPLFSTRANGAGRGLGLSIAAHTATLAGGRLELDSTPGAGCTAILALPVAKD